MHTQTIFDMADRSVRTRAIRGAWILVLGTWIVSTQSTAFAADSVASHARVDLVAEDSEAKLDDGRWVFGPDDRFVQRITWMEDTPQSSTLFGEYEITPFAAMPTVMTFVSDRDAIVRVSLVSRWRENEKGEPIASLVDWQSFRVAGATVVGNPFRPRAAWANDAITLKIQVRKGVPVYLEVAARAHLTQRPSPKNNTTAHRLAQRIRRGVNLSNWLEVPPGEDWGDNSCGPSDFARIKMQGFDHVRLPVGWHHSTGRAPNYTIDASIYRKVDKAIKQAQSAGLAIIINIHHFDGFIEAPDKNREKLIAIWRQIATRYADKGDDLFFEILNEPADAASTELMNRLYEDLLPIIRESNPSRGILVGPGDYNSVYELPKLQLPKDDDGLIVSVHNYDPFPFSHQGATWTMPGVRGLKGIRFPGPPGIEMPMPTAAGDWIRQWVNDFNGIRERRYNVAGPIPTERMLDMAAGWSDHFGRPVHLGEFGAFTTADDVSRANYLKLIRKQSEQRGIGWAIWDWKADFAYWDRHLKRPKHGLKAALFGP